MFPDLVYHYCSPSSFLGILQNKMLWATDFRYMNDSRDYEYGREIFKRLIDPSRFMGIKGANQFIEHVSQLVLQSNSKLYISSFSEFRDDLNQWRSYAGENGFAIGFNVSVLRELLREKAFSFGKVSYNEEEQEGRLNETIKNLSEWYRDGFLPDEYSKKRIVEHINRIVFRISLCKSAAFSAEAEWRGAAYSTRMQGTERFRSDRRGILSYIPIDLSDERKGILEANLIGEIIVGPGSFQDQNFYSASECAEHMKIACRIEKSRVHLRFI